MHFVCTYNEVRDLIGNLERFWVSNCGCRESAGKCNQSRMDVCIGFFPDATSGGSEHREITREELEAIISEARDNFLVPRPYRDKAGETVEGICLCCSCCCHYFVNHDSDCEKGEMIEETDFETCTHCSNCIDICAFGARVIENGELVVKRELCYGCGVCVDVCPQESITMIGR
ncbi:MAG: hypothetical protein FH749_10510 [Firmicutes bacterium]|nr:hypothetical protein [Bacillota bacterium]